MIINMVTARFPFSRSWCLLSNHEEFIFHRISWQNHRIKQNGKLFRYCSSTRANRSSPRGTFYRLTNSKHSFTYPPDNSEGRQLETRFFEWKFLLGTCFCYEHFFSFFKFREEDQIPSETLIYLGRWIIYHFLARLFGTLSIFKHLWRLKYNYTADIYSFMRNLFSAFLRH